MTTAFAFLTLLLTIVCLGGHRTVHGHGMVLDPVARGTRWRCNPTAIPNYNDNELFCGGFQVQWGTHDGKCGVCGDNYGDGRPRLHELGGYYGQGDIVRQYSKGSVIPVTVRITANHKGHFYFDMCNLDSGTVEQEECFQQYPLYTADGEREWVLPSTAAGEYVVNVKLPSTLVCSHCIFRWTYVAGNNWGYCPDGTGQLGCGPQEHFRTCSDIQITDASKFNSNFSYCTKSIT